MTFSIAAYDGEASAFGIAVSSAVPAVGAAVPFVGLEGAVATQSRFNYALGADGVAALRLGITVDRALPALLEADPAPGLRQVHGVDRTGRTFAHTGDQVKDWNGSVSAPGVSVAGNTLVGQGVIEAMLEAFLEQRPGDDLAERLLRALEAGQAAGGDRRGRQSAALLVAAPEAAFHHNLRVDEHHDPVSELRRVSGVARTLGADRASRPRHVPLRLKY